MNRSKWMNARTWLVSLFLLAMCVVSTAALKDKALKKSDLPAAVRKTADEQSKGATVRGYASEVEDGKLQYELQLTVGGHSKDAKVESLTKSGKLVAYEAQVLTGKKHSEVQVGPDGQPLAHPE